MRTVTDESNASHMPFILIIICLLAAFSTSWAGEKKVVRFRPGDPPLLTESEMPRPRRNRDKEIPSKRKKDKDSPVVAEGQTLGEAYDAQKTDPVNGKKPNAKGVEFTGPSDAAPIQRVAPTEMAEAPEKEDASAASRRRGLFARRPRTETATTDTTGTPEVSKPSAVSGVDEPDRSPPVDIAERRVEEKPPVNVTALPVAPISAAIAPDPLDAWNRDISPPPTREEVEIYRKRLELRLLERYNNLPDHAGNVAKVSVVLSKPLDEALDGSLIRAEFDQLVYDPWGKRIPELEKEYYVVVFGSGGAQQVRSDPSIRIGLDLEKTYSERAPLAADPFRNVSESAAFRPAPQVKMPEWWRPDFPELD